jgi:hypothetical protein
MAGGMSGLIYLIPIALFETWTARRSASCSTTKRRRHEGEATASQA